jgi:hypothetical protein
MQPLLARRRWIVGRGRRLKLFSRFGYGSFACSHAGPLLLRSMNVGEPLQQRRRFGDSSKDAQRIVFPRFSAVGTGQARPDQLHAGAGAGRRWPAPGASRSMLDRSQLCVLMALDARCDSRPKKPRISRATSLADSSSAKCPASKICTSAFGTSFLIAATSATSKTGS